MSVSRVGKGIALSVAAALVAGLPSVLSSQAAAAAATPQALVVAVPQASLAVKAAKPKITGVLAVGSTLKAVPGKWSPKTKFSYQWLAAGKAIKKATKSTYKLTKAEHGKQITVKVTGKVGASQASKTSSATLKVMLASTPKLAGKIAVGSTLSANRGSWTTLLKFSFSWLRDGKAIPGATRTSYELTAADAGHKVSVKVTGKRSGFATVSKVSAAVKVPAIIAPPMPTISGTPVLWSTLTAYPGTWAEGTSFSYQWLRNGKAIPGATKPTYLLELDDAKQLISVTVTGKLGSNSVSRTSEAVSVSADFPPSISGTAVVGSTLTVDPGSWATGTHLSYQWLRNGADIPGATKPSYTLVAEDGGQSVSVKVTGTLGSATVSKTPVAVLVPALVLQSATPTFSGSAAVGSTLTVVPGAWTAGTTFTYQWFVDGAKIARGTTSTLRPGYLEAGRKLTVTVTGSKPGYSTVAKTSDPTATIPTDATFVVGVDIPAGTYQAPGSASCIWQRGANQDGDLTKFDGLRVAVGGPALATLKTTDKWFFSEGCGPWSPVDLTPAAKDTFADGDFLVGTQVRPGLYQTDSIPTGCLVWLADGASGSPSERIHRYNQADLAATKQVSVPADTYLVSSAGCGTWSRVGDAPPDPVVTPETVSQASPGQIGAAR